MSNEKQIQKLASRFRTLDYLMLYWIAKSFAETGENKPIIDNKPRQKIRKQTEQIYTASVAETDQIVRQSYASGYKHDKNKNTILYAGIVSAASTANGQITMNKMGYAAYQNTLKVMRNAVHTIPFRFQKEQLEAVNEANNAYASGNMTWMQAKQKALNLLADQGIVKFIDRSGREWTLDSYVDMGIRTGIANASRAGFINSMTDRGKDLVFVSAHRGACHLCTPWEGKVLSLSGDNTNYPSLQDAMNSGLFHPNCAHILFEYIEGFSDLISYDSPENDALYQDRQEQRYLERNLRKWKRRQAAAITPEEKQKTKMYVKRWREHLVKFTEQKGLPRKTYRESI